MHGHDLTELLVYLFCVGLLLLGWWCVELILILYEIYLIYLGRHNWLRESWRIRLLLIEGKVASRLLKLRDEVLGGELCWHLLFRLWKDLIRLVRDPLYIGHLGIGLRFNFGLLKGLRSLKGGLLLDFRCSLDTAERTDAYFWFLLLFYDLIRWFHVIFPSHENIH